MKRRRYVRKVQLPSAIFLCLPFRREPIIIPTPIREGWNVNAGIRVAYLLILGVLIDFFINVKIGG